MSELTKGDTVYVEIKSSKTGKKQGYYGWFVDWEDDLHTSLAIVSIAYFDTQKFIDNATDGYQPERQPKIGFPYCFLPHAYVRQDDIEARSWPGQGERQARNKCRGINDGGVSE